MRRRAYLTLAGIGLESLAGCASRPEHPTATDRGSPSPPPPESPGSTRPRSATPTESPSATTTPSETPAEPVWRPQDPPSTVPVTDILGSTHASGLYHFTDEDFLNEGAKRIRDLGSSVIKVWLHRPYHKYPFNSEWNRQYGSMVEVARTRYFRELFDRDFSTFVLEAQAYVGDPRAPLFQLYRFGDSVLSEFRDRFEAITRYLLEEYDGTGKTFVLQHWEGDNLARGDNRAPLTAASRDRFRKWLTARQEGVERARDRVDSDVTVLHATEVNFVLDAMREGTARLINEVVPAVEVDLVSYSAWELAGAFTGNDWFPGVDDEASFDGASGLVADVLDFIDDQSPAPNAYVAGSLTDGQRNVFLGEFGQALHDFVGPDTAMRSIRTVTEASLNWGVRWALYWQLYDNEKRVDGDVEDNEDVPGHYLIRPDGTKAPTWDYFSTVLSSGREF